MQGIGFRVLGPVLAEHDGQPMALPGERQRAILAAFLLNPHVTVATGQLIELVWGIEPPRTAKQSLQNHISKLRRFISLAGDQATLVTATTGYVLEVESARLDLTRFQGLAVEGRVALGVGDTVRASSLLARALDEWRGELIQDVHLPGLMASDVSWIHELHRTTLAAMIESELKMGRYREVCAASERLLIENPFDEQAAMLAALAYYGSGRIGEATATLSGLRRRLGQELGIDVGQAVDDLERRILRRDPTLLGGDHAATQGRFELSTGGRKRVVALAVDDEDAARGAADPQSDPVREVLTRFGATIFGRFETSQVVALFGFPRAHEDDAIHAARAATEIGAMRPGGQRVGIAAGEVSFLHANDVTSLRSFGPLERATTLARSGRAGDIVVAAEVLALGRGRLIPATPGPSDLPLPADSVRLRRVDDAPRLGRYRAPMVGRDGVMTALRAAFDRAVLDSRTVAITLVGEAGVGKSRLVEGFTSVIGDRAHVVVGRSRTDRQHRPLHPFEEIIETATQSPIVDVGGVESSLAELIAGDRDGEFLMRQLTASFGQSGETTSPEEMFWATRRILELLAVKRPLIVVLEDVQWAEGTCLDLVQYTTNHSQRAPILWLITARPEFVETRPTWTGGSGDGATIELAGLSERDAILLAEHLLDVPLDDPQLKTWIVEASGGIPLYIEELAKLCEVERGDREGLADVGGIDREPERIPPTIRHLLHVRLDRLLPNERRVLERAAILGASFTDLDLAMITPEHEAATASTANLARLVESGMLKLERMSRSEGREYAFHHVLLREAVYEDTPADVRAIDHATFARALARRTDWSSGAPHDVIGAHAEAAARLRVAAGMDEEETTAIGDLAISHLCEAAGTALDRGAYAASAGLARRALTMCPEGHRATPDLARIGASALFEGGDAAGAERMLEDGCAAAEQLGNETAAWRLRVERASVSEWLRPAEFGALQRKELAEDAIAALERLGDRRSQAVAYRLLGDALNDIEDVEAAVEAWEAGRRIALAHGDRREAQERMTAGATLGPLPAQEGIELLRRRATEAGWLFPDHESSLALLLVLTGATEEGFEMLRHAHTRAAELGASWREAVVCMDEAEALLITGDPDQALGAVASAVTTLRRMGDRPMLASGLALEAEALLATGSLEEALARTVESERLTEIGDRGASIAWRGARAHILAELGHVDTALSLAHQATALAADSPQLIFAAEAFEHLGAVLEAANEHEAAADAVRAALQRYELKGAVLPAAKARRRLRAILHDRPAAT